MKQHITTKQLLELNEDQLKILNKWCLERNYCEPKNEVGVLFEMCLSIGQMIEFLDENWNDWYMSYQDTACNWWVNLGYLPNIERPRLHFSEDELCDALWEAVKQVLGAK